MKDLKKNKEEEEIIWMIILMKMKLMMMMMMIRLQHFKNWMRKPSVNYTQARSSLARCLF